MSISENITGKKEVEGINKLDKACVDAGILNFVNALPNKIVVMDKGRIVEIGKHDDLIAKGGAYHKLYVGNSKENEC